MTSAFSVRTWCLGRDLRMHLKLAQAEEDDLRPLIEPDLHERIITGH